MEQPGELSTEGTEQGFLQTQHQGLREEIISRNNSLLQIQTFTLLAFGTILTIAYSDTGLPNSGSLVLFYNIIALFSYLIYLSNKVAIYHIGGFIRYIDEKCIYRKFSKNHLNETSWENYIHNGGLRDYRLIGSIAVAFFYVGTQLLPLAAVWLNLTPKKPRLIMIITAIACTILTFLAIIIFEDWTSNATIYSFIKKRMTPAET